MGIPLRILIIEDSEDDALLMIRAIQKGGYSPASERVETADAMSEALERETWDIIISDYSLPHFSGLDALKLHKEKGLDIPFIIISGTIGEETAVATMISGAHDYVMKNNLFRLAPAIQRSLADAESRRAHKRAEEALRASEEKFRNYIERAPDGVFIVDDTGRYLESNEATYLMLGFSKEKIDKMSIRDLLAEESLEDGLLHFKTLVETGVATSDLWHRHQDGSKRCLTVNAIKLSETQFLGFAKDITERKQAEETLKKNTQLLMDTGKMAQVGGWELDLSTKEVSWTEETCRIHGVEPGYKTNLEKAVNFFAPESRPALWEVLKKAMETGELWDLESLFIPSGSKDKIWVRSLGRAVYSGGKIVKLTGTFQNIDKYKRAEESLRKNEERYRTILDNIEHGYYEVDIEGKFTFFNDSLCNLLGYSRAEMIGMNSRQYTEQQIGKKLYQAFNEVYRTGKVIKGYAWEIIKKDGSKRFLESTISLMKNISGHPTGFNGIVRDITERKRSEEENAKLEGQLQQAQKMESVGRLAGGVAHDFNNMLSVILGHTEMALEQVDPAQPLFADLQDVQNAAKRSADLTRQLLAFARKQIITPKLLDLNETIEGMLKMMRRLIGENINLAWLPGKDQGQVKMDPSQIDQILVNLCVNARDAIAGVGKISIKTGKNAFPAEDNADTAGIMHGEYVRLAFSDDGRGMDKETLAQIFEPFFTTKDVGKGTGLGLSTVYGIIKQNNGFINVYSEPGHGTTFKVYLPRHIGEVGQMKTEVPAAPAAHGRESILLVEDEPSVLKLTTTILKRLSYIVLAASTPGEAIKMAEAHRGEIDLLITDVVMPEMNGQDLAIKITSLCPNLKRLFMSGYTADVIAHQGVLAEGVHFIQKPFSRISLAAKVREVLDYGKA